MKVAPWNWPLFPLLCIGLLHITTLAALAGLPWGCISVASLGVWLRFASRTSWEPLRAQWEAAVLGPTSLPVSLSILTYRFRGVFNTQSEGVDPTGTGRRRFR